MKTIRIVLAFHNRTEVLEIKVTEQQWKDKRIIKNELETTPTVISMEEVK